MQNRTVVTEFLLLGLSSDPNLQILLFLVFLFIYLMTLTGNALIVLIIKVDPQLHSSMYFFLGHLAFADICCSTVIVPKMLKNFLEKKKNISLNGRIAQIFFFLSACAEVFMLSAMAYDRYIAVCKPLHYARLMSKQLRIQLVAGAWVVGFLYALINAIPLLSLSFCERNIVTHFSCELPLLLVLCCTKTFINKMVLQITVLISGLSSFFLTLIPYIHIISIILRVHSKEARQKTFSTCSSHLIVVGIFYVTAFSQYLRPTPDVLGAFDKLVSIQYSILTPMLNFLIYTMKNKSVKESLVKNTKKL
ncbi:OR5V1 protein, partial [Alectura lathami]|nr:OR5V1 protein [Alectura lathami]